MVQLRFAVCPVVEMILLCPYDAFTHLSVQTPPSVYMFYKVTLVVESPAYCPVLKYLSIRNFISFGYSFTVRNQFRVRINKVQQPHHSLYRFSRQLYLPCLSLLPFSSQHLFKYVRHSCLKLNENPGDLTMTRHLARQPSEAYTPYTNSTDSYQIKIHTGYFFPLYSHPNYFPKLQKESRSPHKTGLGRQKWSKNPPKQEKWPIARWQILIKSSWE